MTAVRDSVQADRGSIKILIVGQAADPHVRSVCQALEEMGAAAFVLDPHPSDDPLLLTFSYDGVACCFDVRTGDRNIDGQEISAVWWRLKPGLQWKLQDLEAQEIQNFRNREWQHALEGLEGVLAHARWINPRSADRRARHKGIQLLEASRLGFAIPSTLMSNDPQRVAIQLKAWEERAIYKPFTSYFPRPGMGVFTSQVKSELIDAQAESVSVAPGIFQEQIDKAYELRITVIGGAVFPVRIDSQQSPTSSLDWRRDYDALTYAVAQLPVDMEQKLLRLHAALGLDFGAYDFIVTPSGEYVFLEVNPAGQWLWLEEALGLGISRTLAQALVSTD